jgi:uncharacterized membrane protein YcaP (DUF421 family)
MDLGRIAVRALVAYVYLLVTTRASGKRVVSQATPFDLLVSLIIGDLIDDALWGEVSMVKFGAAVGTICVCDLLVKVTAHRSDAFLRLVDGRPTAVLRDGVEDRDALRKEQMNEEDLAHLLRLQGVDDRKDVRLGLVESDHEVSVILRPGAEPAQKKDAERVKERMR